MHMHIQASFPCKGCSSCGTLSTYNGSISSNLYYPDNSYCKWIIASSSPRRITITFSSFSTESGRDILRLYECPNATCNTSKLQVSLSGYYTCPMVKTLTGYVLAEFTSDDSVSNPGFTASWTSEVLNSTSMNSSATAPTPAGSSYSVSFCIYVHMYIYIYTDTFIYVHMYI
jgi:hypothetical protein